MCRNPLKLLAAIAVVLSVSCGRGEKDPALFDDLLTLRADISDVEPCSLDELFSHVEAIPLETADSALIIYTSGAMVTDSLIYVYNSKDTHQELYGFDHSGRFVHQIGRTGHGPGEYSYFYGYDIDMADSLITLLSPYGTIYNYALSTGEFIDSQPLPARPNYYKIKHLGNGRVALFSAMLYYEDNFQVYDTRNEEVIYTAWPDEFDLVFNGKCNFYEYGGKSKFAVTYTNQVYEIDSDSLKAVYQWDFGDMNMNPTLIRESVKAEPEKGAEKYSEAWDKGIIKYWLKSQGENSDYYYVGIKTKGSLEPNGVTVFYNKHTGRSVAFEHLEGGLSFKPLCINDEYALALLAYDEQEIYRDRYDPDFELRDEVDNPTLLKFYFKR